MKFKNCLPSFQSYVGSLITIDNQVGLCYWGLYLRI